MKKLFLITLVMMPVFLFAQTVDSAKVEQYCEMTVSNIFLDNKVKIEVNYGDVPRFFKWYGTIDDSGFIGKFSSLVDGLNYLGLNGWKLVQVYGSNNNHYVFKREFLRSAAEKTSTDN